MEIDTARRRIEMLTAHFSPTHPTHLFPMNCSGGLSSITGRYDNKTLFARQDSRSQACFMRQASMEQSSRGDESSPEVTRPMFSQPASTNSDVPKVRKLHGAIGDHHESPVSEPPKFSRPSDEPMRFSPEKNVDRVYDPGLEEKLSPKMDVTESQGKYVVFIELPGVNIDDVRVEVDNTTLSVRTLKRRGDPTYYTLEVSKGPYEVAWPLPVNVNPDAISAELLDGLLRIIIPKRRVPIW